MSKSVLGDLATSLGRRDEVPNQELAERIAKGNDKTAVEELVALLAHKKKDIQNDAIKVLYEVGERKPKLIASYTDTFVKLLEHKNNRLQWGAMTALNTIAREDPAVIHKSLKKIVSAAGSGSVITRDQAVNILIQLASVKKFAEEAYALLLKQMQQAPTNQLPMYAENALPYIDAKHKQQFMRVLTGRLDDIEKESKRKRVEKVIAKLGK